MNPENTKIDPEMPFRLTEEDKKNICILLPVLNEEAAIGPVIKEFRDMGFPNILVMDGNSRDRTREVSEEAGARVLVQSGKGKGQAMIEAFSLIQEKYIVMLDGDGTNPPSQVDMVMEPIIKGKADHVIGNRLEKRHPGAFTKLNYFGNRMMNRFYRFGFRSDIRDTLTGYHAFTTESVRELNLTQYGFVIETEMIAECHMKQQRVAEVNTDYYPREIEVKTKLNPIVDGGRIILAIFRYSKYYNPRFYFGFWGLLALALSVFTGLIHCLAGAAGLAAFWSSHSVYAASFFLLAAFLLFLTGAAKDVDAVLYREAYQDLRKMKKE